MLLIMLTVIVIDGSLGDQSANTTYLTIVQTELERDGAELRQVSNNRVLLPVTDDDLQTEDTLLNKDFTVTDKKNNTVDVSLSVNVELYSAENVLDHIVFVTNTGNTEGYVRTWFAFQMGDLTEEEFNASVLINKNTTQWIWKEFEYGVVIDGQRYAVVCAEHNGKVVAGGTTTPNLLQIMLRSGVSNEIVSRLDDNNGTYKVQVCSQVVSDRGAWSQVGNPWK